MAASTTHYESFDELWATLQRGWERREKVQLVDVLDEINELLERGVIDMSQFEELLQRVNSEGPMLIEHWGDGRRRWSTKDREQQREASRRLGPPTAVRVNNARDRMSSARASGRQMSQRGAAASAYTSKAASEPSGSPNPYGSPSAGGEGSSRRTLAPHRTALAHEVMRDVKVACHPSISSLQRPLTSSHRLSPPLTS